MLCLCQVSPLSVSLTLWQGGKRTVKQPRSNNIVSLRTAGRPTVSNRGYYCSSRDIKVSVGEKKPGSWEAHPWKESSVRNTSWWSQPLHSASAGCCESSIWWYNLSLFYLLFYLEASPKGYSLCLGLYGEFQLSVSMGLPQSVSAGVSSTWFDDVWLMIHLSAICYSFVLASLYT